MMFSLAGLAQQAARSVENGNKLYREDKFDQAETAYREALQADEKNTTAQFNLANSLVKQKKTEDADKLLGLLSEEGNNNDLRAKAIYNHGVILTRQKKLEESIGAYKKTLRLKPDDQEARENLEKALMELKKKNPPKKQDDTKKKDQQQKQQPKPRLNQKQVQQHLKLLEQKEKQVQQRLQKNSSNTGSPQPKDW
jgi:Ca-activated chloride channel family protein